MIKNSVRAITIEKLTVLCKSVANYAVAVSPDKGPPQSTC